MSVALLTTIDPPVPVLSLLRMILPPILLISVDPLVFETTASLFKRPALTNTPMLQACIKVCKFDLR